MAWVCGGKCTRQNTRAFRIYIFLRVAHTYLLSAMLLLALPSGYWLSLARSATLHPHASSCLLTLVLCN